MNRRILLLNLALLALLGSLGWMIRARWLDRHAQEQKVLSQAPHRTEQVQPPSPPLPQATDPSVYDDVARKTLFSKDRDPTPIIDVVVPPPPKPEEPPPPRPVYYGQMAIDPSAPVAILSVDQKPQKGYSAGEEVGPFKLIAFDREKVTFEWHGKTLEYEIDELKPKASAAAPQPVAAVAPAAPPQNAVVKIDTAKSNDNDNPTFGAELGQNRACDPSDKSPIGTVSKGYRKILRPALIGVTCVWEPIK